MAKREEAGPCFPTPDSCLDARVHSSHTSHFPPGFYSANAANDLAQALECCRQLLFRCLIALITNILRGVGVGRSCSALQCRPYPAFENRSTSPPRFNCLLGMIKCHSWSLFAPGPDALSELHVTYITGRIRMVYTHHTEAKALSDKLSELSRT